MHRPPPDSTALGSLRTWGPTILLGLAAAGCAQPEDTRPSVLLIVVDTLRADHTSLLGYERETTPHLDAFAAGGMVFENARASSSWTIPSTASLLTGLSAAGHGMESNESHLPETAGTIGEVLRREGYRTALFSANPYVSRFFGFGNGYGTVVDYANMTLPAEEGSLAGDDPEVRSHGRDDWAHTLDAAELNASLLEWLDGLEPGAPFFAHAQYMEPHWPYDPPPPFDVRFGPTVQVPDLWAMEDGFAPWEQGTEIDEAGRQQLVDAYDGAVAYWDDRFGALLAELDRRGRLGNTIVVVVSDHGEAFYEHGTWGHQNSLYDELVRVPLMLRGPGVVPGREPRSVSSRDLAPTLLQLAGLDPALLAGGRTLFDGGDGGDGAWTARLENEGRTLLSTIEHGDKWISSMGGGPASMQRFVLHEDPAELRDLAAEDSAAAAAMRAQLQQDASATRSAGLPLETVEPDEHLQGRLRALGYAK